MTKIEVALVESDPSIIERLEIQFDKDSSLNLVGAANNGVDAWNLITKHHPDVIVMDLLIPYMDGFELLERINRLSCMERRPKIIITTVMSNDTIVKESFKRGADYYIIKPYDELTITNRIKELYYEIDRQENPEEYSIDVAIENNLNKLNFPVNLKGYQYLICAIKEVLSDDEMLYGVTKVLYPTIAKKHQSTPARVEKAIRHAIEIAWNRNDEKTISEFWNNSQFHNKRRPTNSEFIAILSQKIKSIEF